MSQETPEPNKEITAGILVFGVPTYWFPVIVWRGKCYALSFSWRWPLVRVQHVGLEMPLQEEKS